MAAPLGGAFGGRGATCLVRHQNRCRDVYERAQHHDAQDAEQSCDERVDVVAAREPGAYSGEEPTLARSREALLGERRACTDERVVVDIDLGLATAIVSSLFSGKARLVWVRRAWPPHPSPTTEAAGGSVVGNRPMARKGHPRPQGWCPVRVVRVYPRWQSAWTSAFRPKRACVGRRRHARIHANGAARWSRRPRGNRSVRSHGRQQRAARCSSSARGCCTNPRRGRWLVSRVGSENRPSHPSREVRPSAQYLAKSCAFHARSSPSTSVASRDLRDPTQCRDLAVHEWNGADAPTMKFRSKPRSERIACDNDSCGLRDHHRAGSSPLRRPRLHRATRGNLPRDFYPQARGPHRRRDLRRCDRGHLSWHRRQLGALQLRLVAAGTRWRRP